MAEELQGIPENNKELDIKVEETILKDIPKEVSKPGLKQPSVPPKPLYFTITPEGVKEYITTVNESISSRFVKNTLFNAINTLLVPVYPEKEGE